MNGNLKALVGLLFLCEQSNSIVWCVPRHAYEDTSKTNNGSKYRWPPGKNVREWYFGLRESCGSDFLSHSAVSRWVHDFGICRGFRLHKSDATFWSIGLVRGIVVVNRRWSSRKLSLQVLPRRKCSSAYYHFILDFRSSKFYLNIY